MNNDDVDERIRAALRAAAEEIDEAALRAVPAPAAGDHPAPGRRARWLAPVLAAAAVVAVAVGTAAVVRTGSASKARPATSASPTSSSPTSSSSPEPTASPSTVVTSPPAVTADTSPTNPPSVGRPVGPYRQACYFDDLYCRGLQRHVHYQPLWPFPNYAAEQAWQAASRSSGAQPWHLDGAQTALLFAQNYLGFADITTAIRTTTVQDGIEVGVGYPMPGGQLHTAAALHLVRYSDIADDPSAGWEVVGTADTDFSLEQPAYGSAVTSPMTVGGHITGVDENIVLDVKDLSGSVVTGTPPAVPAGGANSPWSSPVSFHGTGVLTVVAFTGGHLTQHERFAIQGVHT